MKVIQVAGFLGSGKTTAIVALAKKLSGDYGKKVAVIVNEIGDVPVDAKVAEQFGLKVAELGGGCLCCELLISLAETLVALAREFAPDLVLIEPTGVALPEQVREGVRLGGGRVPIEAGPVVVMFDALDREDQLSENSIGRFVRRQLGGADIVAINKVDAVEERRVRDCEAGVREAAPGARVMRVSAVRGDGIAELARVLVGEGEEGEGGRGAGKG